ncbi:MAG: TetR/AcrR family transcriptional regulator [Planctomycetota bacterium]
MTTLTPKQQEIRQREDQILATAVPMLREGGLMSISMDAIAKQMRYTRGTIYNHFANKEEIVLALAARAVQRRVDLFRYAASLCEPTRDRVASIGIACEAYTERLPDDFAVEQMVRHDSVWQKTSDGRRELLQSCEHQCIGFVSEIINEAISAGDFKLPRSRSVADVVLGLWSLVYGGQVLEATSPSLAAIGITDHRQAIRRNCNAMLDGWGWKPLYEPSRYNGLVKRVLPALVTKADELNQYFRSEPGPIERL